MIERSGPERGTHWGAIAFTLATAAVVGVIVSSAVARDILHTKGSATAPESSSAPRVGATTPAPYAVAPDPDQVGAILLRRSTSPVIFSGTVTTLVYLFRNTGTAAWVKGTPAQASLGIMSEDPQLFDLGMAVGWPHPTRPAIQDEAIVEPGGSAQFSFRVKGTVPGRYQLQVAPVIEGVAWADAAAPLDVTVR